MENEINNCPACGNVLFLDNGKWKCNNCGNSFSMNIINKYDMQDNILNTEEKIELYSYQCIECKEHWNSYEDLKTSVCPYCGNDVIVKDNFLDTLEVKKLIPFKISKEEAIKNLKKYINRRIFSPKIFKKRQIADKVSKRYVPAIICDCEVEARMEYWGKKRRDKIILSFKEEIANFKKEGLKTDDYVTVITSNYMLMRNGLMKFEDIVVGDLKNINTNLISCVKSFDCNEIIGFEEKYVKDSIIDNRFNEDEVKAVIEKMVKNVVYKKFRRLVKGYYSVTFNDSKININFEKFECVLLPLYFINEEINKKIHTLIINGQTGKVGGYVPIDKSKIFIYCITSIILFLIFKVFFGGINLSTIILISSIIILISGYCMHKKSGSLKKFYGKKTFKLGYKKDFLERESEHREYRPDPFHRRW